MSDPTVMPDSSTSSAYLSDLENRQKSASWDVVNQLAAGLDPEPKVEEKAVVAKPKPDAEADGFLAKALDFGANVAGFVATGSVDEDLPGQIGSIAADAARGATEVPRALAGAALQDVPKMLANLAQMPSNAIISLIESDPEKRGQMLAENKRIADEYGMDVKQPSTVTGNIVREVATFGVAMAAGMKPAQAMLSLARVGPRLGAFLKSPLAGGLSMAALQPYEHAIDKFAEEHPEIQEPLAAFYAGPAGEPGAEATERLKQGLIGLGLGVAADGLMAGMKGIRNDRIARAAQATDKSGEAAIALEPKLAEEALALDPPGTPSVRKAKPASEELAAARLQAARETVERQFPPGTLTREEIESRAAAESTDLEVSFDTLTDDASVKAIFDSAVRVFRPMVDEARRGVRSHEQTQEAAVALGFDAADLLARRKGQNLNAEEVAAYKAVFAGAGRQLDKLIDLSLNRGQPLDHYRLRQGYAKFGAMASQFMGARAEAGRALNAWAIKANGDYERALLMARTLEESGGADAALSLARKLKAARTAGATPGQIGEAARKGAFATTTAAVEESVVNGMLWLPKTHVVNLASPYIVAAQKLVERAAGRQIQRATGLPGEEQIAAGEVAAMLRGGTRAIAELAPDRSGALQVLQDTGSKMQAVKAFFTSSAQRARTARRIPDRAKVESREPAITSKALGFQPTTWAGRLVDYYGSATRVPQSMLAFEDDIGKVIGYEMERHALAFREATSAGGTKEQVAERYAALISDTPEHIHLRSLAEAERTTFNNPVGNTSNVTVPVAQAMRMMRKVPVLGMLTFPFVGTPANILRYGFENTPLAPFVGQFRRELQAGGARRDLALARMTVGTAVTAAMFDLAESGHVYGKGPENAGLREARQRQGIQPDSATIGGINMRLNQMDPIGFQLSLAATLSEQLREKDLDEDDLPDVMELAAAMAVASTQVVESKSWMQGVATTLDAIRHQDSRLEKYFDRQVTNMVPFSSLLRGARTIETPEVKDYNGPMQAVASLIPGVLSRLPSAHNLWGEPVKADEVFTSFGELTNPMRAEYVSAEPIDAVLSSERISVERVAKRSDFGGVPVSFREFPEVYEKYTELAGNGFKVGGYGAKDFLNAVVTGNHPLSRVYAQQSGGPDGGKSVLIKKVIYQYRQAAQGAILDPRGEYKTPQFIAFREMVGRRRVEEMQKKMPVRVQ